MSITVQTASAATLRYRDQGTYASLGAAITEALAAQVEGSIIARVTVDRTDADVLAAAGEIYQTEGGEWMDAGQRMTLVVE